MPPHPCPHANDPVLTLSPPGPLPPGARTCPSRHTHGQVLSELVRSSWDAQDEAAIVCYLFLYAVSLTWYYSHWAKAPILQPQQLAGAHSHDWFTQFVGTRLNLPLKCTTLMDTCTFGTFTRTSAKDELYAGTPK
jgi:hypothetical protein